MAFVSVIKFSLFIFIGLFCGSLNAAELKIPSLTGPVVDEMRLLNGRENAEVSAMIRELYQTGAAQMSILISSSLQGYDIETYSIKVAEAWKLGKADTDKGLLLVIAPQERKMRLEVGYGLEGDLTDAFSRRLLDQILRPYFRENQFAEGIRQAVFAVSEKLGASLSAQNSAPTATHQGPRKAKSILHLFFLILFIIALLLRRFLIGPGMGSRHGGFFGGGGFGGGGSSGWGGGGGGFGGGGSSSSW